MKKTTEFWKNKYDELKKEPGNVGEEDLKEIAKELKLKVEGKKPEEIKEEIKKIIKDKADKIEKNKTKINEEFTDLISDKNEVDDNKLAEIKNKVDKGERYQNLVNKTTNAPIVEAGKIDQTKLDAELVKSTNYAELVGNNNNKNLVVDTNNKKKIDQNKINNLIGVSEVAKNAVDMSNATDLKEVTTALKNKLGGSKLTDIPNQKTLKDLLESQKKIKDNLPLDLFADKEVFNNKLNEIKDDLSEINQLHDVANNTNNTKILENDRFSQGLLNSELVKSAGYAELVKNNKDLVENGEISQKKIKDLKDANKDAAKILLGTEDLKVDDLKKLLGEKTLQDILGENKKLEGIIKKTGINPNDENAGQKIEELKQIEKGVVDAGLNKTDVKGQIESLKSDQTKLGEWKKKFSDQTPDMIQKEIKSLESQKNILVASNKELIKDKEVAQEAERKAQNEKTETQKMLTEYLTSIETNS